MNTDPDLGVNEPPPSRHPVPGGSSSSTTVNTIGAGTASTSTSSTPGQNLSVEIARQRAIQAAEYYHKNVLGTGGSGDERDDRSNTGGMDNDALRAGVTPASSDAYYKAKLRAGFIDLRNSYNEKIRPRGNTYAGGRNPAGPVGGGGGGGNDHGLGRLQEDDHHHTPHRPALTQTKSVPRMLNDRRGLYRSNSSLELDYLDESPGPGALRRDYGSASSLDVISNSGDSFFAMLQDYRNENMDQRAPAPPQIHEVLRGRDILRRGHDNGGPGQQRRPLSLQQSHELNKLSNGVAVTDEESNHDGSQSPRLKQKSQKNKDRKPRTKSMVGEASSGILKKLRGAKSEGSDLNSGGKTDSSQGEGDNSRLDERQKRKAVVHYDCQSVGITIPELIRRRTIINKRKNTTTGASAASTARSALSDDRSGDDLDQGDGKSNELVLACPFFRNEIGGEEERTVCLNRVTAQKRVQMLLGNNHIAGSQSFSRDPACNGASVLDNSPSSSSEIELQSVTTRGLLIEHIDHGAFYYKKFFIGYEHQNYFGIDEQLGPVAISLKREKLDEKDCVGVKPESLTGALYQYRIILRTSDLSTLRGAVLEDVIPSSSRLSSTRGLPVKDVIEFVLPELNLANMKAAIPGQKTQEQLVRLDQQGISKTYKIGVMYCKAGQSSEEEMYNNENSGPAFDEFLDCIGRRIRLKGFEKYRGGLDCKTDSTGTHSYYTSFHDYEIMFHVSTFLPFTPNNRQQLLRKRHIGNDIVTIVFQEPGALPFTPKTVRSHFQHVFIIVRAHKVGSELKYSLAISRSKDVPVFGPPIPEDAMFNRAPEFAEFLLTKAINAENAAHKSDKFTAMATRTRQEYLKDLATNFVTTNSLDSSSKLSKFSLGSGRKKDRPKIRSIPDIYARGGVVWSVQVEDFGVSELVDCFMAISAETMVLVDEVSRQVIFTVPSQSVIGWTSGSSSLRIYHSNGQCICVNFGPSEVDEVAEVVARLGVVSKGCETQEMILRRNGLGQLGFHVHYEGIISDIEPFSPAWQVGLRQGSRLVEICKIATATLTHDQMVDLLRTSMTVSVVVIPPFDEGTPRRGQEESRLTGLKLSVTLTHSSSLDTLGLDDISHVRAYKSSKNSSTRARHEPLTTVQSLPAYTDHGDHRSERHLGDTAHNSAPYEQISHQKQASQESAASRSSGHGSLDGQMNDGHPSRSENVSSSEGFTSGEDRHSRHGSRDGATRGNKEWAGNITIYPAYGREREQEPQPKPHPNQRHGGSSRNRYYGDQKSHSHHPEAESQGYTSSGSGAGGYTPRSANYPAPPATTPSRAHNVYPSQGYAANSLSNLSDLSSSQSSGGGSLKRNAREAEADIDRDWERGRDLHERSRSHDDQDKPPERPPLPQEIKDKLPPSEHNALLPKISQSPGGRRRQTIVGLTNPRRDYLNLSPHSSTNSSPRGSRKNLAGSNRDSEESLATRLRPGVSPSGSKVSAARSLPSSTFQEELMRLIDPEVSLAELETSFNRESSRSGMRRSSHRLQRTLSDESMCSTLPMGRNRAHGHEPHSTDVLFSSESPARTDQIAREKRLSPRVTQDMPSNLNRLAGTSHAQSSPMIPLPDSASTLEWASLLDAAKAFEGGDAKGASSSSSSHGDFSPAGGDVHMGMKSSKHQQQQQQPQQSSQQQHQQHQQQVLHDSTGNSSSSKHQKGSPGSASAATAAVAAAAAVANTSPSSNSYTPKHPSSGSPNVATWRGSPESAAQRIHDLEAQLSQMKHQLEKEQKNRSSLEAEVSQLQQENVRLQEESQTAAAQLRKFTEWFFNTIDRQ